MEHRNGQSLAFDSLGMEAEFAELARETIARNITFNNILLGTIDTDGLAATWERRARDANTSFDAISTSAISKIPAGRLGTPDEVAALCLTFCSSAAGYITNQNVVIDGGAYAGLF